MKKLFNYILVVVMAFTCCFTAVSCGNKEAQATTRMTAEINPQIEFMLDKNNKVVSVTGLNEEGELIISGEAFVGLTAEDAIELFVEISNDSGYLLKGSAYVSTNKLSVSVSGKGAEELFNKVNDKAQEKFQELGLTASVEKLNALGVDALRKLVLECDPTLTEEDVKKMNEEELIKVLNEARKETQELIGVAVKDAYYKAKEYEVKLAENEKLKEIVNNFSQSLTEAEKMFTNMYVTSLESLNEARKNLNDTYFNLFVAENSGYQTALRNVLEKKQEVLELRKEVAELPDGNEKDLKVAALETAESVLKGFEDALNKAKQTAENTIATLQSVIDSAETAVENAYNSVITIMPTLKTTVNESAANLDKAINQAKDKAFENFEKAHKTVIEAHNEKMENYRDQIKGKK